MLLKCSVEAGICLSQTTTTSKTETHLKKGGEFNEITFLIKIIHIPNPPPR